MSGGEQTPIVMCPCNAISAVLGLRMMMPISWVQSWKAVVAWGAAWTSGLPDTGISRTNPPGGLIEKVPILAVSFRKEVLHESGMSGNRVWIDGAS